MKKNQVKNQANHIKRQRERGLTPVRVLVPVEKRDDLREFARALREAHPS